MLAAADDQCERSFLTRAQPNPGSAFGAVLSANLPSALLTSCLIRAVFCFSGSMFVSFLLLSFPTFSLFLSRRSSPAAGRSRSRCRSSSRSGRTYGHNNRLPVIRKKNLPSPSIETEISFAIVFLVVKSDARKFCCLKNGPLQRLFSGKHSLAIIPLSLIKFASITQQSVFKFAYDGGDSIFFFKICWKKLSDVFVF